MPDYLDLFRSLVPEETPEQKAARLLRERQARTPEFKPATTPNFSDLTTQQQFDDFAKVRQQIADADYRQVTGAATPGVFTSSPLLGSTGSLQDAAQLYNKPVTSMLGATGLPQAGETIGTGLGRMVEDVSGTSADLGKLGGQVGAGIPRMVASGLTGGVGMVADTALQSLAETGDPIAAAKHAGITAATVGAAKVGGREGERVVADWLTKQIVPKPTSIAEQITNRNLVREAYTGVLPKVGGGVGAATAAAGVGETANQLENGPHNPFTAENVFSQAANAAVMGGLHMAGTIKSPRNLEAQARMESWFREQVKAAQPAEPAAVRPLLQESLSGIDRHPEARKNWWVTTMDKAAGMTDPTERAAVVSTMADQLVSTKNLGQISLAAGRLSQIKPPETMGELVDVSKRYNELRDMALAMIDERAASGEDVPSAAAVRQMAGQGLLPKMDLEWFKNEFGHAAERTLTGDDMQAFRILGQKVVNHTLILARTAKEARAAKNTAQSIGAIDMSSDMLDERNRTLGFVSAVNTIPVKEIRDALAERYIHHEQNDQQYGKGEADKFMEEITDVVNKIVEGKTPEQLKAVDWDNAVAQVEKRVVQLNDAGEEVRPIVARDTRLADYVAKDVNGEYTKKVYGRPNRSQRELLAQEGQDTSEIIGAEDKVPTPVADEANWQYDLGQEPAGTQAVEPTVPEVKGGGTAPKGLYDPKLDAAPVEKEGVDTQALALQLKDNIAAMDDRKAWVTLAPELVTSKGTVTSAKREAIQPYAKLVIAAIMELGTGRKQRGEQTGEAIGPAGAALLQAKGMPEMPFEKYRAWLDELMNARGNPKYRENIVKRLTGVTLPTGQKSGIDLTNLDAGLPIAPKPTPAPDWLKDHYAKQQLIGASRTGDPLQDTYRVMMDSFLRLGYTPEEAKALVVRPLQVMQNFNNPTLQVAPFDVNSAYVGKTPEQIAGTEKPAYEQLATAGMYNPTSPNGRPVVTLALQHTAGMSPKELVAWHNISTFTHELVHDIQDHAEVGGFGPYGLEYRNAYRALASASGTYTPEQRRSILTAAVQAVVPQQVLYQDGKMNENIEGLIAYGSNTMPNAAVPAYEFVNAFAQIVGVGATTNGDKLVLSPEQIFNALPTEAALFAKGVYRNLHDSLDALVKAIENPAYRARANLEPLKGASPAFFAKQVKWLVEQTQKMVVSKEPQKSLERAQAIVAALDGKQWSGPMLEISADTTKAAQEIPDADYSQIKPAYGTAKDLLFGPDEWHKTLSSEPPLGAEADKYLVDFDQPPPKGPKEEQTLMDFPEDKRRQAQVNIGAAWKWIGLFQQTMAHMDSRGLPLAQDVGKAFLGLIPAQQRMSVAMLRPFMMTDEKFNPNSPLVAMRQDKSLEGRRDNALLNQILQWQQQKEKSGIEQRPDGTWAATKELTDAGIGDVRGFLPQRVVGSVLAMQEVGRNMGQQLLSARIQSVAYRVAKLLMASQPKELAPLEYERTLEAAGLIVRGLVFDQQAVAAQGMQQVLPTQRNAVVRMLDGGLVDQLKSLNKMVTSRTHWWATEQRPGDHLVVSYNADGVKHTDGAQSLGEARKMQADLQKRGYSNVSIISKEEKHKVEQFDSPEGILHHYMELENKAMEDFITKNPANLTPDQLALIEAYAPTPGAAVGEMLTKRGTNVYLKQRRSVPTAYGLDYVDSMREYVSRIAGTVSRQMTQAHVELILSDARLAGQDEFKTLVRQSLQAALTPNSEWQRAMSTAVSSYFLGGNLSSAIVNGFDTIATLPETLLSQGGTTYNTARALKHYADGVAEMVKYTANDTPNMTALRNATAKLKAGQKLTPEETKVWVLQRAYEMKVLDRGQMHEVTHETDIQALATRAFGTNQKFPTLVDVAKDPVMRALQMWMVLPRMVHSANNQIAFFAGVQQGIDAGMTPQEVLDHANKVRTLATFSGGKANPTGAMAQMAGAPAALSLTRLGSTMQSYAYGTMSKYMSHASNMIDNDPNLTPLAKRQARQAFGYMLSTHLALAGLMGVAGVGAAMALLNKYFDVQAEAGVRKGIKRAASVLTDDPNVQGMITELAMNGAPNQLLGANVGSRIGMGNVMGLSSYEGFNLADVVPGAAAGAVASVFKGLGYAGQGDVPMAVRSIVPAGLKNAVDLAASQMKYGDMQFRGPDGQVILNPTTGEKAMYAAGLQPSRLSQARSLSRLTTAAVKSQQRADAKKRDEAALAMLQGNLSPANELQAAANRAIPPTTAAQATSVLSTLAGKAAELQSPQDPLAKVSYAASPEAREIVGTFPAGTRQMGSEFAETQRKIQLQAQAGVPLSAEAIRAELLRAQMVDEAMRFGLTRAEALKSVELRLMGSR